VAFTCLYDDNRSVATLERKNFAGLVEAELPGLRRYAMALLRSGSDADDLVQETVLRALDKEALWRPGTNLRAWLFTIMHNLRVNAVRRRIHEGAALPSSASLRMATPAAQVEALALRDLRRALDRLEEDHRAVLLLVGFEGMSYEEVGTVLALPPGTVRSRLSRARARLRRLLEGEESATRRLRLLG
jgi:RNA polymerase sigma-70 factor, ECF subfamily